MNPKIVIGCVICMACLAPVRACVNTTGTTYDGKSSRHVRGWRGLQHALKANPKVNGAKMEQELRGLYTFNERNDYAVALMYLGRNSEAVELLKKLEQEKPGQFFIAANLGTAYELSGNNVEALKWINEGIKRNPKDHDGTEWLHAKILEAKIAQAKDAKYFEKHSVLELEPGAIGDVVSVSGGKQLASGELAKAIQYQLSERLQFVKPPDPAVASLLFDYAAIEAVTKSMESAKHILKMATDFGYPAAKVAALEKEFDHRLAKARAGRFIIFGLVGVGAVALLFVLYKRGIFVLWR